MRSRRSRPTILVTVRVALGVSALLRAAVPWMATFAAELPPSATLQNIHSSHSWDVRDACGRWERNLNEVRAWEMAMTRCGCGRLRDMSTPSERIFAQPEDGAELRDFLPPQARHPMTLARTAIGSRMALRCGKRWRTSLTIFGGPGGTMMSRSGSPSGHAMSIRVPDAYLGALAEHIGAERGLAVPPWSIEAGRFLARIWWPRYPGLWARAIVESPAAFRRRGILLGAGMLSRV
jgi:hypothetical protein